MKDLKKLLKNDDSSNKEMRAKIKMDALAQLSDEMSNISGSSVMEKVLKPKASITVATDDPKKLPEALEKAESIVEKLPSMEDMKDEYMSECDGEESEDMEKEDSEEDSDIDSMSHDQLKAELLKLKKMMK